MAESGLSREGRGRKQRPLMTDLTAQLIAGLRELGEDPAAHPCERYLGYIDLLVKWNRAYNLTAEREADGTVTISFGEVDTGRPNFLPIMEGWNYTVRLYRPRAELRDGSWKFPEIEPVG